MKNQYASFDLDAEDSLLYQLSPSEFYIFHRLRIYYLATGKPLPCDNQFLRRLAGANGKSRGEALLRVLSKQFREVDGVYRCDDLDKLLGYIAARRESARRAALSRHERNHSYSQKLINFKRGR